MPVQLASPVGDVNEKINKYYPYLLALVAAVGGFLFGYDLSIISGAMIFLKRDFGLNDAQWGLAVSSAMIGCVAGPILGGICADRLGRKKTLVLAAFLYGVSAIGCAVPHAILTFNIYRFVGGLGVGLAGIVSPMYIAEIAPAKSRGRLITMNQLAIVLGSVSSIVIAYFLSFSGNWRLMFGSAIVPVGFLFLGLILVPESPRWLVEKQKAKDALDILTRINGAVRARVELQEIQDSLTQETGSFGELFQPGIRTALLIAVSVGMFTQLTGVGSVLVTYAPMIFQKAGFASVSNALGVSVIMAVWGLFCTIAALLLVDRIGRRWLLLAGTAGMAIGLALLSLSFRRHWSGLSVLFYMMLSQTAYLMTLAPLGYVVMSENFPTRIRSRAMAFAAVFIWLCSWALSYVFPVVTSYFEKNYGTVAGAFWFFTAVAVYAFFFCYRMIPETKGKTLEQIADYWTQKGKE